MYLVQREMLLYDSRRNPVENVSETYSNDTFRNTNVLSESEGVIYSDFFETKGHKLFPLHYIILVKTG